MSKKLRIVLLGAPGAGKGSQAAIIKEKYGLPHISTGDMLRAEMRAGTELGSRAKALVERGALVPDDVIIGMVRERLAQADCEKGFILDGFPRTAEQAAALDAVTAIDIAVNVDAEVEGLIKRITGRRSCPDCKAVYHVAAYSGANCAKCGAELMQRADDKEDTVRSRLAVYHEKTRPLIAYYREKGLLVDIDGNQSIERTFASIAAELDRL